MKLFMLLLLFLTIAGLVATYRNIRKRDKKEFRKILKEVVIAVLLGVFAVVLAVLIYI